jgi:hypothetical protein
MSKSNYPMDDKGNKLGDAYGWDTEAGDFSHLDNHIVSISNFNFYKKALSDVLPELLEFQKIFNNRKFTKEDYTKFDEIQKKIKSQYMSNVIIEWSTVMEWLIKRYPEICVNIGIRKVLTEYYNPMITKAKELLDKFKKFEYMYSHGLYNIYQNFIYNGFYNLGLYIEKINEMIKLLDEIIILYPELVLLWRTYRIELDYCLKFKPLSVSAQMVHPFPENSRPRRPIGDDEPQYTGPIQTTQMSMVNQNVVQGNQALSYKEKYLKYKQKYLKLKNEMNQ